MPICGGCQRQRWWLSREYEGVGGSGEGERGGGRRGKTKTKRQIGGG